MKQVKKDLQAIADRLEKLRKKTEEMSSRLRELGKITPVQKEAGKKNVATPSMMGQVIRVMKRHRKVVGVATLMKKDRIWREKHPKYTQPGAQKGEISRISRGVYVAL